MALVPIPLNASSNIAILSGAIGSTGAISVVATASPGTTIGTLDYNASGLVVPSIFLCCTLQVINTSASALLVTIQAYQASPPGSASPAYGTIGTIRLGATGVAADQTFLYVINPFLASAIPSYGTLGIAAFAGTTAVATVNMYNVFILGGTLGVP